MPPGVDGLIAKCMAKDPDERYANGSELAHAIGELLDAMDTGPLASGTLMAAQDSTMIESLESAPRSRRALAIASVTTLALGVLGFTFVTLRSSGDRPSAPVVAAVAAPVPAPPPPAPPSPAELARPAISKTATAFVGWAKSHAGEPCPSHGELGSNTDPWGHAFVITCTDQPAAQRIGITSPGPDGKLGTDDDISSWALGAALTDLLRGPRWAPRPIAREVRPAPPAAPKQVAPPPAPPGKSFAGTTLGDDGIPTTR
jgi:hypothetical protein